MDRTILHVDMNSCYASIEALHRPELRGQPLAVAGDVETRRGIILAKNDLAKRAQVRTGEAIWQARQKCPRLVVVPPRYELYLRFSRLAREIYGRYSDQIEPFGLDEAWVDVSGSGWLFGGGETIAQTIRTQVKEELGITVSVGVSFNKVFAKLGSDYQKPDAVTVFTRADFRARVWPLPVGDLLYVGPATEGTLRRYGVSTIGRLAQLDPERLHRWFGKWGYVLHTFANGRDQSPVAKLGDESIIQSVGNSVTAPRDLTCDEDASLLLHVLADSVAQRLRDHGFRARRVQISLRDSSLATLQRQTRLDAPTALSGELHRAAMALLRQSHGWGRPLRALGLRGSDLVPDTAPQQLDLLMDEGRREKQLRLEQTVDGLRHRFGHFALTRAVALTDPALGGINPRGEHTIHPVGYFRAMQ